MKSSPSGPIHPRRVAEIVDAAVIRIVDVLLAFSLLLILLPLLVLLALLVKLESPGPVLFRAERVGYRGQRLRMLKFRKMHHGATGPNLTVDDDGRFTRVGAFLARTKLDELPQLWHVLIGEMSLVGPRPETADFVERTSSFYERILAVRPGITGLSQLAFAQESRILDDENPISHYTGQCCRRRSGSTPCMHADGRAP